MNFSYDTIRVDAYDAMVHFDGFIQFPPEGLFIDAMAGYPVSDGLTVIRDPSYRFGYMDMEGNIVFEPRWGNAFPFHGGVAVVEDFNWLDNRYFIDLSGNRLPQVSPPAEGDYNSTTFYNHLMTVYTENHSLSVMDDNGHIVYTKQRNEAAWILHYYVSECAWYISEGEQYGLINREGEFIIEPLYGCLDENGTPFIEDVAAVAIDGLWGYIRKDGTFEIEPRWDEADSFCNGLARVESNGMMHYIDHSGRVVWSER